MNEEIKRHAKSKSCFLMVVWIAIVIINTILMLVALSYGYSNLSVFISLMTPVLIILCGLFWWIGVNKEYKKLKKLQVMDDTGIGCSMRDWRK